MVITADDCPVIVSLYKRKYQQYYAMALSILKNSDFAQDVVQDAFQDLMVHYERRKTMPENEMERYMMAIVRNKAKRKAKWYKKEASFGILDELREIEDDDVFLRMEQKCDIENVRRALQLMPHRSAEYLVMHYVDGLSDEDIAEIMHVRRSSVPILRYRAKNALREILLKMEEE